MQFFGQGMGALKKALESFVCKKNWSQFIYGTSQDEQEGLNFKQLSVYMENVLKSLF